MNLKQIIIWLKESEIPFPLEWGILVFAVSFFLLFIIKIMKSIIEANQGRKVFFLMQVIVLPMFILSVESLILHSIGTEIKILVEYVRRARDVALWMIVAWLLVQAVDIYVWNGIFRKRTEGEIPNILKNFLSGLIYIIAVFMILTYIFNIEITGLVVSSGIIAGVIGLSMQSTLSDLIAGIALTIERPYRIDDWIELKDGTLGRVIDINWRTTRLLSWKKSVYVIPNGKAMAATIHNYTLPDPKFSESFYIRLSPEVTPVLAKRLLLEAALSCDFILKDPAPSVKLIEAEARPYKYMIFVTFRDYLSFFSGRDELLTKVWNSFTKAGIMPPAFGYDLNVFEGEKMEIREPRIEDIIADVDILRPLTDDEKKNLLQNTEIVFFHSGDTIVEEGDPGNSFFVIISGVVSISHIMPELSRIELERLGIVDCFGEMSLLTGEPRSADISAVTECQVIEFKSENIMPILKNRTEVMEELADIMAKRQVARESLVAQPHRKTTSELIGNYANEFVSKIRTFFRM